MPQTLVEKIAQIFGLDKNQEFAGDYLMRFNLHM
jgi:hypothetical protein